MALYDTNYLKKKKNVLFAEHNVIKLHVKVLISSTFTVACTFSIWHFYIIGLY